MEDTTCTYVWRVSDCKNVSSCWDIATEGPVGRIPVGARECYSGQWIVGASKWQFSDGPYAEMLYWHAGGPIA
jgi:hypothetical protein